MEPSTRTVVGIFDSAENAKDAAQALEAAGFAKDQYDLASRPSEGLTATEEVTHYNNPEQHERSNESAISRFFGNLFGTADDETNDEASRYATVGERSGAIITVHAHTHELALRAAEIMDDYGTVDVEERANKYGYDTNLRNQEVLHGSDLEEGFVEEGFVDGDLTARTTAESADLRSVNVIQEELHVGKREIETGGARLRSRIIERPVEESLRLREERVFVTREAVNRPATEADFEAFREGTIELRETAEIPVVSKEARVIEQVTLGKETDERTETIRETVRNTEVEVEHFDGKDTSGKPGTASASSIDQ
jgi:stress response protein YsnF